MQRLDPQPGQGDRHRGVPLKLIVKSAVVLAVIMVGVTASGVTASSLSSSRGPSTGTKDLRRAVPAVRAAAIPATTLPPVVPTTTTDPPAPTTTAPPAPATAPTTATSADPATATTTPPAPNSSVIRVSGTHLILNGSVYHFTGVNAYEAATDWGVNAGCGADLSDAQLNQLFSSLPPNSLVRIWGFQGTMATNFSTHQLDWGPLDRVFAAAAAHGQRLIVSLAGQSGVCDNVHWEDLSWYDGGFKDVFDTPATTDGRGLTPLSYWSFLQAIVNRYKTSPALGMWEPMSEAEASTCPPQYEPTNCSGHQTCPNEAAAAQALRYFFDTVGGEIHALDPTHLVESGLIGGGQCGTQGSDYQYVSASPGIDVLSVHDYYGASTMGGDQWNGMAVRFAQDAALNKPVIDGEMGIQAGAGAGCVSAASRNSEFASKISAQLKAGSSGVLAWDWVPSAQAGCSYDVGPTDPMMAPGGAIG